MEVVNIPIAVSYEASHPVNNPETLINLFPRAQAPAGISRVVLETTPILSEFSFSDSGRELGTDIILDLLYLNKQLFFITEMGFFISDIYGNITSSITFPAGGRLDRASAHMVTNGFHVLMRDEKTMYIYIIKTKQFLQIQDGKEVVLQGEALPDPDEDAPERDFDFVPTDRTIFKDGYFLCYKKDSNRFYISGLYDYTWNALDYASAEGSPDNIIDIGVASATAVAFFGRESIEFWYNAGMQHFPFLRISGGLLNIGVLSKEALDVNPTLTAFVGNDKKVYVLNGYRAETISNQFIEDKLREAEDIRLFIANWEGLNFIFIVADKELYGFTQGSWFKWEGDHYHNIRKIVATPDGIFVLREQFYMGGNYKLWKLERGWGDVTPDGVKFVRRTFTTRVLNTEGRKIRIGKINLLFDTKIESMDKENDKIFMEIGEQVRNNKIRREVKLSEMRDPRHVVFRRLGMVKSPVFTFSLYSRAPISVVEINAEVY